MNLTAITDEEGVYLKHFYDSLALGFHHELSNQTLCDVGAGAGFPSIPLKIVFPDLKVTIVDSLNKRIMFLNTLVETLGLTDVQCFHDRAEIFGQNKNFRASYDVVTARAVAKLSVKAAHTEVELEEAKKAIAILGGKVEGDVSFDLPYEGGNRHVVTILKTKETPNKYPRKPGIPLKKPL